MKQTLCNRVGFEQCPIIGDDEVLVLYKKGGRGDIVGVYNSINEILKLEAPLNSSFARSRVADVLYGKQKWFTSLYHNCKCVPRIIKKEKLSA